VILDGASDDDTVDMCKAALKNIPLTIFICLDVSVGPRLQPSQKAQND